LKSRCLLRASCVAHAVITHLLVQCELWPGKLRQPVIQKSHRAHECQSRLEERLVDVCPCS
jgi:hypothetical protein